MFVSCLNPRVVYNKYIGEHVSVPCGKCAGCTSLKANSWSTRLERESADHRYTVFVTLTYAEDKRPLIDISSLKDTYVSETFDKSLADSSEYVKLRHGLIPVCSKKDIQDFIKRLRINLYRNLHLNEKERILRYFCAAEFGPSSFHPHYHLLLWFDTPKVAKVIKEHVYKAWFVKNPHSSLSSFLVRNEVSFVRSSCSSYVAAYLNTDTHLPAILREPLFRTFHLQSTCPPIGTLSLQPRQVSELLLGNAYQISVVRPTSHRVVSLSLWRCLESRYFPKCPRFASLSSSDRIALYRLSSIAGEESDFKSFLQHVLSQWVSSLPLYCLLRKVASKDYEEDGYPVPNEETLRRLFYMSRRVRNIRRLYGLSVSDYVARIEAYYGRKEYARLVVQLQTEQVYASNKTIVGYKLQYLPFLIDSQFYENIRKLSPSARSSYEEQFHLTDDFINYVPQNSFDWKRANAFYTRLRTENTKTRIHKDFVAKHPEYQSIYLQNLLTTL